MVCPAQKSDTSPAGSAAIRASDIPFAQLAGAAAIAIIRRTHGPAYRPVGAAMLFTTDGRRAGNLSSGCIDADIALQAAQVITSGQARDLRYGQGSPFRDLQLPCGGGLDIRILPLDDAEILNRITRAVTRRADITLWLSHDRLATESFAGADFALHLQPDLRFVVFGKGPEAIAFSQMTASAGYETWLSSPDPETFALAGNEQIRMLDFPREQSSARLPIDGQTAVTLFFHDHELEPPLLQKLLGYSPFFIGAQGSMRTAETRRHNLQALGLSEAQIARVQGPIGLIPSTRDARTLAVSVLAEILNKAR